MKTVTRAAASAMLLFITLLLSSSEVYAVGALFARPRWSTQEYAKMWIKKVDVKVDIQEQIAVTHVTQVFFNEMNTSVEAVYMFPLPENATISQMAYTVNGQRYEAEIRERAEAVADYNQKVRQWLDPALLEYLGNNLFRLSIVPINATSEVTAEITYVEPLKYDFGIVGYDFRLNTLGLSSKPLETVTVNVDASSNYAYKSFSSPSHGNSTASTTTKISDKHYKFFYGDENYFPDKDLKIEFQTMRSEIEYHALTYKPSAKDSIGTDSYYAIWISPPDSLTQGEVIPQNIVFTVDVSGSVDGTRLDQIKEALNNFLQLLDQGDMFNIVKFGTTVELFQPDLVAATSDNIQKAKNYVQQLSALGMTNISEALTKSLQQSYGDSTSNSIVFLTDGYPTWGDTVVSTILSDVKQNNTKNARIFSFGVGDQVKRSFLMSLAEENHGFSRFITADDSIALVIKDHFMRIAKPVLTDISLDLGGLMAWDQYPKTIGDLFWGSQLMQVGLYKTGGSQVVTLKGKVRSKDVEFKQQIDFPDTLGGHRFVPRVWAKNKIDYLLNLIGMYGEKKELVDQIVELSLRFQILTPYTAFYADPTDPKTGVEKKDNTIPDKFALAQNYPNPFNPETKITYSLPRGLSNYRVVIRIFNALGQLVLTLVDTDQAPGNYTVAWNGRDSRNQQVPSGIYFYTIQAGDFQQTRKMVLMR
ncbi:MAG TPA: VIT domain-containing protein [Ignavibacteriales bacterium]|nr:VIT domain-containing protein [Ignavibacteriales bacterium]